MKYYIILFLLLFVVSAKAQITLEHTYPYPFYPATLILTEVDSAEWKYVICTNHFYLIPDTIFIFNTNHILEKQISIPLKIGGNFVSFVTKNLFTLDNLYGYMVSFDLGYPDQQYI